MRRLNFNQVFVFPSRSARERLTRKDEVRPTLVTDIGAHVAQATHTAIRRLNGEHEGVAHIHGLERRNRRRKHQLSSLRVVAVSQVDRRHTVIDALIVVHARRDGQDAVAHTRGGCEAARRLPNSLRLGLVGRLTVAVRVVTRLGAAGRRHLVPDDRRPIRCEERRVVVFATAVELDGVAGKGGACKVLRIEFPRRIGKVHLDPRKHAITRANVVKRITGSLNGILDKCGKRAIAQVEHTQRIGMQGRSRRHHRGGVVAVAVVQQRSQRQCPRSRGLKIDINSFVFISDRDNLRIVLDNLRLASSIIAGARFFRATGQYGSSTGSGATQHKTSTRYSILKAIGDAH